LKQILYKIYGFLHSLKYSTVLKRTLISIADETTFENHVHLRMAGEWLLYMQNDNGGYSRKFSFIKGRDKSYIETTGYIVSSLIELGKYLDDEKFIHSAHRAGEWLLEVQNSDGSFSEIDGGQAFAFDTGQCLMGLISLYKYTKDKAYLQSAKRAAYWLKDNQEDDGSWQRVAFYQQKHTYYSRVASAMYQYALEENDTHIKEAALKHINWILSNQSANGYFKYASFAEGVSPYLHTLIYILEGLMDIYDMTSDKNILEAVLKNAGKFKDISLERDLLLCSQYDQNFNCVNNERCLTGLAQWAGIALRTYRITHDMQYKKTAVNTLFYLKAKQIKSSAMKGGFSASIPFWGRYGGFDFVNWTNKFFIDSMLMYDRLNISLSHEQETFVSTAFMQTKSIVTENISYTDHKYLKKLEDFFKDKQGIIVLDIGCGKGVIINELSKKFPGIDFVGVDPVYENNNNITKGTIYHIPFVDKSFDVVMSFEVLQHTYIDDALKEVYRVLKNNGTIIIGERNPFSILGFLKPILELKNRWMYPYDSPFREKWYNKRKWIKMLKFNGFVVKSIKEIEGSGKKFFNKYYFIGGEKNEK
jgi:ubiquinone/menaquinone biosynthesis C-methylase UbiE